MEQQPVICPWCDSEIVWDEEFGPEEYCPHCDNELKGYRSVSLNLGRNGESDGIEFEDDEETSGFTDDEQEGYRNTDLTLLALEEKVERILNGQEEVPECPSCREYMLESGRQTITAEHGYEASVPEALGTSVLPTPFQLVWYVCPACCQMQNRLSMKDRDEMMKRLSGESGGASD
ncbi:hypothetical protein AB6A23_19150 [Paenibacillus tarimensis]